MKRFALWLCKITGVYDQIYWSAFKDVGAQMSHDKHWWHQSEHADRSLLSTAFHFYSESLKIGCRPNMMEIRRKVDRFAYEDKFKLKQKV